MGRANTSWKYIDNEKSRRAAFEKRRNCLKKKAYELSTLCDVPVCVLLYPDQPASSEPLIYPENVDEARSIFHRYVSTPRDSKRSLNLQDVVVQAKKRRRVDGSDHVQNRASTSAAANYPNWLPNLDALSRDQLENLASVLDYKLQFARERIWVKQLDESNAAVCGGFDPNQLGFCRSDEELGSLLDSDSLAAVCGGLNPDHGRRFCGGDQQLGSLDATLPDYAAFLGC